MSADTTLKVYYDHASMANALVRVRGSARTAAINDTLRLTELLKVDGDTVTTDFDLSRL